MAEYIKSILALLGATVVIGVILGLVIVFVYWLKDQIEKAVLSYKIKHRFDKPPTADCYCRDCIYYRRNDGVDSQFCGRRKQCVSEAWFCWEAYPIKHERKSGIQPQREDA